MAQRSKAADVTVRTLAPAPAAVPDGDENAQMLYRAVPQIDDPSRFKVEFKWIDPGRADDMLREADADPEFRQRPTYPRDVRRWKLLMESERFVHFLPNGPLCFDEAGMLLNGKHRLLATAGGTRQTGFMIVRNVPRWMFRFFDTPRVRSLNDVFHSAARMTKAQTGSTMRLALRYEEFLHGMRPAIGWRHWNSTRDEHFDVDDLLARREDLGDLYVAAEHASRKSRLVIASLMVFRFYQQLAWPDGADRVAEFFEALKTGATPPGSPSLALRAWSRDNFEDRVAIAGKRELHLLLLNRMFALHVQGDRVPGRVQWAHGFPMSMPYHPDGPEVATKNALAALGELDRVPAG